MRDEKLTYISYFLASCVEFITLLGDILSSVFPSAHLTFIHRVLNSGELFATTMVLLEHLQ
jgi:solute carrier family 32 (vesicular inhibitory amino acid transporter)